MTDLERRVREAMIAHQLETPDVDGLVAGLRRHEGATRARWPIAVAAAACVLLVAGGAVIGSLLWRHDAHGQRNVAQSSGIRGTSPVVPPGWKPVSFHGLQVYVPAEFGYDQTGCGSAFADTVNVDFVGEAETCAQPRPAASVNFVTTQSPNLRYVLQPANRRPMVLDGHAAISGVASDGDRTQGTVQIPDLGVVMGVDSSDAGTVAAIVKSASVVSTDANGCASVRPASLDSNPTPSAVSMVPGTPTSARLCRYDDTGLVASSRLTASDASALATAMNEHPPAIRNQTSCTMDGGEAVQATFTSADGGEVHVQVIVRASCAASLSNGLLNRAAGLGVTKTIITLVGSAER